MKKIFLIFIFVLLIIPSISAIRINEVEMNPEGSDSGNEWVELYNNGEINLTGYKLVNNDGDGIILNESFSGYHVYTFNKQWLDNTDEKVFLYNNDNLIDETDIFKDSKNNNKTWQLCDGSWIFIEETKNSENNCVNETQPSQNTSENNPGEITQNSSQETSSYSEAEDSEKDSASPNTQSSTQSISSSQKDERKIEAEVIKLIPKDIKTDENTGSSNKNIYAIYGFVTFCILLTFLFLLRKKKFKNEFD